MKFHVLIENTACADDLRSEHGLSLYLELGEKNLLFDAGQTAAFSENAAALGLDLGNVDAAILSHGHYDHGGGLPKFLEINKNAPVYVSRYAFQPHYHGPQRYIGLDTRLQDTGRIVPVAEDRTLYPGVTLGTCPRLPFPLDTGGLHVLQQGTLQPEDFRHEQYLLIEEQGKRICVSGCSHRGILNILEAFRPDVFIGGFHLMNVQEEGRLREIGEALLGYGARYYTGHCTGQAQFQVLKTILGDRLEALSGGRYWEI